MSMKEEFISNPLMEKRKRSLPGVTFRLPSRGEIYKKGVLADNVENGEMVVYPMRLREELKMKSFDSIFQGSAVSETISYCVPEVLTPEELCPTDIDYLITAIKKQSHGNDFLYKDVCMKIEKLVDRSKLIQESVEQEFEESQRTSKYEESLDDIGEQLRNLDNQIGKENTKVENKEREFDPVLDNENNTGIVSKFCEFKIPLSHFLDSSTEIDPDLYEEKKRFDFKGFDIELQQISFKAFKEISNLRLQDNPHAMGEEKYFEYVNKFSNVNLARRIRVVDNIENQDQIEEWVNSFSLEDRSELLDRIADAFNWGIDFNYTITCSACGKSKDIDMSYLNPLYFFLTS